jgi:hypothetical protein
MFSTLVRGGSVSAGLRSHLGAAHRRLHQWARGTTWWREILVIGVLYGAYELSRGLQSVDIGAAANNGREILHFERMWHLDPEQVLNQALAHTTVFAVLSSYFYSLMHYLVTPAVLIWMYRRHRTAYGTARTALAISTAVGLVGYFLLPTAPPRMLEGSGLRDTLADTQQWGWWGGEGSVPRGWGALTNQFAAMPSLHVGWAIWCGVLIAIYAQRRWVKILGIAYPLASTVVVMATGNHYLLDAIAGAITMAAGGLLAAALPKRHRLVPEAPEREPLDDVLPSPSAAALHRVAGSGVTSDVRTFPERQVPFADSSCSSELCRPGR